MIKMMYDDELYSWYPNDNIQSSNIIREYRMIYITLLKYICYIFVGYKKSEFKIYEDTETIHNYSCI